MAVKIKPPLMAVVKKSHESWTVTVTPAPEWLWKHNDDKNLPETHNDFHNRSKLFITAGWGDRRRYKKRPRSKSRSAKSPKMEEVASRSLTRLPSEPEPGTPGKNWARRQWWEASWPSLTLNWKENLTRSHHLQLKRELGGRTIDKIWNRKGNTLAKV